MGNRKMFKTPDGKTILVNKADLTGRHLREGERFIPVGEGRCPCCGLIFKNGLLTPLENAAGDFDKLCPDCYEICLNG